MQSPPHDPKQHNAEPSDTPPHHPGLQHTTQHEPGSALAVRTEYRQSQSRAARLRLLVDTGQELNKLTPDAMRQRVLQRACAFLAMDHAMLLEWEDNAAPRATASLGSRERLLSLPPVAQDTLSVPQWQTLRGAELPNVLWIALPGREARAFGALVLANSACISAPDNEDIESLQLLATLLAAHLENGRLLDKLLIRERTMSDLLHRLLTAQEDERKRMAYDLHDGLAQTLAGLHQRLQGFAGRCPELPALLADDLKNILALAQHCVGEGRQLIAGLRPAVLDDFGLLIAVDKEADRLRDAGLAVKWQERCEMRLPSHVEITLFRIAQESINNILKHADATQVQLSLALNDDHASLMVEDDGVGFITQQQFDSKSSQHLGLAAMRERATLLGGRFTCVSRLQYGTRLRVTVPSGLNGTP